MTQDSVLFDRRTLDRFRKEGVVTEEQIKEHYKKLPDCAEKLEKLGSDPTAPGDSQNKTR